MDRRCGISIDSFVINRNESSFTYSRSKFIFIWTTKNLHNRFWMNAKGFSHSGIIQAESRTYFALYIYFCLLSILHDRYIYLDVRWAVSLYYTNVLIQMTHLHSNVLQLAIEFSEIIYVYSVWHVDLKLIQIFIFVAISIVLEYVQCWSWIKICAKRNIHNTTIEGWICTFREQNNIGSNPLTRFYLYR